MKYDHIKDDTSVECRSNAEAWGIIKTLEAMGVPIYSETALRQDEETYPHVTWYNNQICRTYGTPESEPDSTWVAPDEFIALFDPANQSEQLPEVYGHTPVIKDGGKILKVGCQEIPFETVKTIYKAMKKAQKTLSF